MGRRSGIFSISRSTYSKVHRLVMSNIKTTPLAPLYTSTVSASSSMVGTKDALSIKVNVKVMSHFQRAAQALRDLF